MIDIYDVLDKNKQEVIEILKGIPSNSIEFAHWDEERETYVYNFSTDSDYEDMTPWEICEYECPWVSWAGKQEMVVEIKLNDTKDDIKVLSTEESWTKCKEGAYATVSAYNELSAHTIYDKVGELLRGKKLI